MRIKAGRDALREHARRRRAAGFSDILLGGLMEDGGLAVPESYPQVDARTPGRMAQLDLSRARVRNFALVRRRYSRRPSSSASSSAHIPRLFSAPTKSRRCASCSPACISSASRTVRRSRSRTSRCNCSAICSSMCWRKRGAELNIVGATSGDTGSAAEYAMRGKRGIRVFMLSPHGR